MLKELIADTLIDTGKIVPFLFLTYLLMEYLEDKAGEKTIDLIKRKGQAGPFAGAVLGLLPQCGFSAAAASLFAGGVITTGTLLAIFLSTSDEMLPILLSEAVPAGTILKILLCKAVLGMATGFLVDGTICLRKKIAGQDKKIHDLCEQDHCHCEEGNIFLSALRHTVQVAVYILILSFAAGLLMELIGKETISAFLADRAVAGVFLTALIGLIPNCAASVMITELFLKGFLSSGQMIAGLLVGAGVGLFVLFRTNRRLKENLRITLALYGAGVIWGLLFEAAGITF